MLIDTSYIRHRFFIIFVALVYLLMLSCSPKYYGPSTQNIPNIEKKGALQLSTAIDFNHVDINVAYGLSDNINVLANANLHATNDEQDIFQSSIKLYGGGVGFHKRVSKDLLLEIYGLGTYGSIRVFNNNEDLKASAYRSSIQPSLTYLDGLLSVSLSTKISALHFFNIHGDLMHLGERQEDYLYTNRNNFILEPALTIKTGNRKLKGIFQLGRSINISNATFRQYQVYATIGLTANFNLMKEK